MNIKKFTITIALLLNWICQLQAQADIMATRLTVNYCMTPLETVLEDVSEKSGAVFSYSANKIPLEQKIDLDAKNIRLQDLMNQLYELTGVRYELIGGQVVLSRAQRGNIKELLKVILQDKFTISGYIRDSESGEALIGASIYFKSLGTGVATNTYGFYSISLAPSDSLLMAISYMGYNPQVKLIHLYKDIQLNIDLLLSSSRLDEIVISGSRNDENVQRTEMSVVDIPVRSINSTPVIFGERDPLKLIQLLPGVQSGNEGSTGYFVRGGNADQNLVILDEAIIYNPNHLFGLFSTFNSRAISNVNLVKGGFSSEYGGRLSSILNVTMKEGDMKAHHVDGGIGFITSAVTVDGPIKTDKTSFMVSARRSLIDLILKPFTSSSSSTYLFYDINAKINHRISDKDRLYLSYFTGLDKATYSAASSVSYNHKFGNSTGTLRWNHLFSNKLFSNTSLIYNNYSINVSSGQSGYTQQVSSGITDYTVKVDFDYYSSPRHTIKFGGIYSYHVYSPISNVIPVTGGAGPVVQQKYASEAALYVNDNIKWTEKIGINIGIRAPVLFLRGSNYSRLEPRVSARYSLNQSASVKLAYTQMNQFINLIPNSTASVPTDIFIPSSEKVKPQVSDQVAIGFFKNFNNNAIEASAEAYYKTMKNQVLISEGRELSSNIEIDDQLSFGKGWSYGVEFFLRKKVGRVSGWISYTWSQTWQQFPDINRGEKFPFRYDRRHNLVLAGTYELNEKWSLSSSFTFRTGNAITLPAGRFDVSGGGSLYSNYFLDYNDINGYRMPAYHRLDISASHKKKRMIWGREYEAEWVFGLYNAYSRLNTYYVYFTVNENEPQVQQAAFLPIIPSITFNFKF